ncbi:24843_t:CDS:1, partial [Dentiscutata erythropus]
QEAAEQVALDEYLEQLEIKNFIKNKKLEYLKEHHEEEIRQLTEPRNKWVENNLVVAKERRGNKRNRRVISQERDAYRRSLANIEIFTERMSGN